ncbi:digestive cysteine proteinase 2-like [Branchiostoma lanceolatum]|uniref:digestive cysteine proteinase 2-like n=1 Tax=Branchiostoma lanceolatum TaxID=7740 RepID=UPI003456BD25
MRLFIFVALCVAVATALDPEWEAFKRIYGKRYESLSEERARHTLFEENNRMVQRHNEEAAMGKHTFFMRINKFSDLVTEKEFYLPTISPMSFDVLHMDLSPGMDLHFIYFQTNEELLMGLGALRLNRTQQADAEMFERMPDVKVNDTVDWRQKGAVTKVKNQGLCGSCWAFSATGSLEGQHFLKTGTLVSLSEQNLVDCSHEIGNKGCAGGYMEQAFVYIRDNGGIDTEECYPYKAENQKCHYNVTCNGATLRSYRLVFPLFDEKALQRAVGTIGPISVSIDATRASFRHYSHGVYDEPKCSPTKFNHGVLAVGYGSSNGSDYWLVKNSWGTDWGMEGYIMMSRNKHNQCGIASAAVYPVV